METHGFLAPETEAAARDRYEAVGPAAQTVVKETAKAMAFDADEYDERVTGEVIETARDALFASLLEVRTGTREEYEEWLADRDREVVEEGSEHVSRVAWHDALGETVVAATFESEERAAVATLRRQAFGRAYRGLL
jgi:hypothetical protein